MKSIVVTGVSSGIGLACTRALTAAGYRVFGSVRKEADGQRVRDEIGSRFSPLVFDVTDEEAVSKAALEVGAALGEAGRLAGLVNNAGIALGGPFLHLEPDVFRRQLEVNVVGTVTVTRAFAALLGAVKGAENPGRIINIGSVAGRRTLPFMGPYSASKFALEALSDAFRRELLPYGVDVVLLEPGPVDTPIWDKAPRLEDTPFKGTDYEEALLAFDRLFVRKGHEGLPVERVSETVTRVMAARKPKTRYVMTKHRFLTYTLPGLLTDRMTDRLMAKLFNLRRR